MPLGLPITGGLFPELLRRLERTPGQPALFEDDEEDQAVLRACLMAILPGLPHLLTGQAWERSRSSASTVPSGVGTAALVAFTHCSRAGSSGGT